MQSRNEIMKITFTEALTSVTVDEVNDTINRLGEYFTKVFNHEDI